MNISKRHQENLKQVSKDKTYTTEEAIQLVRATANTKFAASVEAHVRLGIDPKKTDQAVRGTVSLPHGTGQSKRIAAFVTESKEAEAKAAGATLVGGEELIKKIKETETTDFDVAVAEPAIMAKLAQIAKILGTRGLMPNPKTGTVSENISQAIKEISGGKVSYKNDSSGNLHQIIGKSAFTPEQLAENFKAFIDSVYAAKPTTVKRQFVIGVSINATMGPGVKVSL